MDVFSLVKFWRNAGVGDFDVTDDNDDDDGSFFDLVFTTPPSTNSNSNCNVEEDHPPTTTTVNVISQQQQQQHCSSSNHHTTTIYHNSSRRSPHIPLFFNSNNKNNNNNKRKILPLDSSSSSCSSNNNNDNSKTTRRTPRSPLRVLMLGFQKSSMKCEIVEEEEEEEVTTTISSLLKRDSSSSSKRGFSKDVVNRYLNLIITTPLLISTRTRRRSRSNLDMEEKSSVFKKHNILLGKSRSSKPIPLIPSRRRDDDDPALDGIQSAILHCKKSYTSPSSSSSQDGWCHVLSRSGSAPSSQGSRISVDEHKRSSI